MHLQRILKLTDRLSTNPDFVELMKLLSDFNSFLLNISGSEMREELLKSNEDKILKEALYLRSTLGYSYRQLEYHFNKRWSAKTFERKIKKYLSPVGQDDLGFVKYRPLKSNEDLMLNEAIDLRFNHGYSYRQLEKHFNGLWSHSTIQRKIIKYFKINN